MCFSVEIEKNLNKISHRFDAKIDQEAFDHFYAQSKIRAKEYKEAGEDNRIFPNYHAPVIISKQGQRFIWPMRYRVRPAKSFQEIPSKYNVFNARKDSLDTKVLWKSLYMKQHALFPFKSFYEWVVDSSHKKRLIKFFPKERNMMWAPCLWDFWEGEDHKNFFSFALITTDPPEEILKMGHDRCPIFLKEEYIDDWLNPKKENKESLFEKLGYQESATFLYEFC